MPNKLIATDHPLTESQQHTLSALLDTILPASDDGEMPSARELDFIGYLSEYADAFIPTLVQTLASFDDEFARLPFAERYPLVTAFSRTQAAVFEELLLRVYSCYYQNDRVLAGIGLAAGPPFPRGNSIDSGDLSLLDAVTQKPRSYRK